MKRLRIFRDFTNLKIEKISKEEYEKERQKRWGMGFTYIDVGKILEFKKNLPKGYKLSYGVGQEDGTADFFSCEYESVSSDGNLNTKFSVRRITDIVTPFYVMYYREEYWLPFNAPNKDKFQGYNRESFYRFEEHDFEVMCKNPQLLLDYLDKEIGL